MSFTIGKAVKFPLFDTYKGPTAVVEMTFKFVFLPGISAISQLDTLVKTAMFGANVLPFVTANYLTYVLESDTVPAIDSYRVTITLAGDTEEIQGTIRSPLSQAHGDPAAIFVASSLFAIILAVGIVVLIFGPIGYRIFKGGLSGASGLSTKQFAWAAAALGLGTVGVLLFMNSRGSKRSLSSGSR